MTPEQVEGNRIIAAFMGYYNSCGKWYANDSTKGHWFKEAKYHSDWNWLMGVVEKIGKSHNVRIHVNVCSITRRFMDHKKYAKENGIGFDEVPPIAECDESDFIGNVWHTVVQFIQWYNTQTSSK